MIARAAAVVLAAVVLAGCPGKSSQVPAPATVGAPARDVSSPAKAILGHWRTEPDAQTPGDLYVSETKLVFDPDEGKVWSFEYEVRGGDTLAAPFKLLIRDGRSAVERDASVGEGGGTLTLHGERHRYVDGRMEP